MKTELQAKYLQHLLSKKKNNEGFTLIELLVVIIIIGILAAIALPSFLNQANKARQSEAQTYIGTMNRAQQAHYLEKNEFGGAISNLELGIKNTDNYTYTTETSGEGTEADAISIADPSGVLKGYGGRVYIGTGDDDAATSLGIVCEGTAGETPDMAGLEECQ
jgi:type IV pilus assembly protein PilA